MLYMYVCTGSVVEGGTATVLCTLYCIFLYWTNKRKFFSANTHTYIHTIHTYTYTYPHHTTVDEEMIASLQVSHFVRMLRNGMRGGKGG